MEFRHYWDSICNGGTLRDALQEAFEKGKERNKLEEIPILSRNGLTRVLKKEWNQ